MSQLSIKLMYEVEKSNGIGFKYNIPIKTICELGVNVSITIQKDKSWLLIIESEDRMFDWSGDYDETDIDMNCVELFRKPIVLENDFNSFEYYDELFIKLKELLKNLKFNKLSGCFEVELFDDGEGWKEFLEDIPNVECAYENCVVCYSPTRCITKCKHSLCYMCFYTIKSKYNDEIEENEKFCPICREVINA